MSTLLTKLIDLVCFVIGPMSFAWGFFSGFVAAPRGSAIFYPSSIGIMLMMLGVGLFCFGFVARSWNKVKGDNSANVKAEEIEKIPLIEEQQSPIIEKQQSVPVRTKRNQSDIEYQKLLKESEEIDTPKHSKVHAKNTSDLWKQKHR